MTLRLLVLAVLLKAAAPATPNVVILLANNVRTDDLSCYNPDTPAPTPNIDRLAAGGVLLRHHTVPALTPTANRAAHLTGQMPMRYGLQESEQGARQILHTLSRAGLPNSTLTYADLLKKSGYRTKAAGGWELGWACESWADACHSPLQHGFDSFHGVPLSVSISEPEQLEESLLPAMQELNAYLEVMANQSAVRSIYRPIAEAAWYQWLAQVVTSGGSLREQARLTMQLQQKLDLLLVRDDAVAQWPYSLQGMTLPILFESLEFIKDSKRAGKPFLLQHSFLHVHDPPVTAPHRVGESGVNAYYDSVLELDWAVGRVLDQLEELELLDDTIIYFASDFNDLMSFPVETSNITDARVPGMFMYRGLVKPHVMKRPTSVLDLLPTVVDVIGQGSELLSMELDGRSLFFSMLTQGENSQHYHYSYRGDDLDSATIVFEDETDPSIFKLYITKGCQLCKETTKLYNLTADPYQTEPIAPETPTFTRVVEGMRAHLFAVPTVPSQLADFWRVMPLPPLFPWAQAAAYRAGVDPASAAYLYSFLEADVVFAQEPGSDERVRSAANKLDPSLATFYRVARQEVPV